MVGNPLEFTPNKESADGSFHKIKIKIKIKVNAKGAKVKARSGYVAVKSTR